MSMILALALVSSEGAMVQTTQQAANEIYRAAALAIDRNDCGKAVPLLEEYMKLTKNQLAEEDMRKIEAQIALCKGTTGTIIIKTIITTPM